MADWGSKEPTRLFTTGTCVATCAPTCPTFNTNECHATRCGMCTLALGDYVHRIKKTLTPHPRVMAPSPPSNENCGTGNPNPLLSAQSPNAPKLCPSNPMQPSIGQTSPPLPGRRPPPHPSPFDATSKWHASTSGYLGAPGAQPGVSCAGQGLRLWRLARAYLRGLGGRHGA
jgi:hypothetical protein